MEIPENAKPVMFIGTRNRVRTMAWAKRFSFAVLVVFAVAICLVGPAFAQTQPQGCDAGIKVSLSTKQPIPGTLLRVSVRSGAALSNITGNLAGRKILFWKNDAAGTLFRAYAGIGIEAKPGAQQLHIEGQLPGGKTFTCAAPFTIRAGHYRVEKLAVAPEFVQPPPDETARIKKEGERMDAIYKQVSPERLWRGAFRFPLAGPRRGGNFGTRRVLNGQARAPHSGLDIPAATGTPVYATQNGRVALAEPLYFSGNTVVIDHGLGLYSLYFHLSAINVKQGDDVSAGALIGRVGATGRVTGPHLHWGLVANEAKVNPLEILPPARTHK